MLYGFLCLIIIGLIIYIVVDQKKGVPYLKNHFKQSQKQVLNNLKEKKDNFDKEITEEQIAKKAELRRQLEQLDENYQKQREDYKERTKTLKADFETRRTELKELDSKAELIRAKEQQEKIAKERDVYNYKLNQLSEEYKEKKTQIDQNFFQYSEQISLKRAALTKEIEEYEEKQNKIIARFKEDEEKRQQADFYRIKMNDIEKKDIAQLKQLALNFSKPNVIYKLLYEVYYKTKLEELFKRILGDNKDKGGIYKITNITNQKIYIGRTTKLIDRWRTHSKRGCNIDRINGQLYDAMFEEGLENFTWEIVEICSKEEQSKKEKYWISFYHSDSYGYNGNAGG